MNRNPTSARRAFQPRTIAIAFGAAALMLMAGSLAMAKIVPNDPADNAFASNGAWNHIGDEMALPVPVIGKGLFVADQDAPQCFDRQTVVDQFQSDAAAIGGRTIEVPTAIAQASADQWRDELDVERVTVTGVVAHLFLDERSHEWTADLVELDESGCAMSRTLMPVFTLNALFAAADATVLAMTE